MRRRPALGPDLSLPARRGEKLDGPAAARLALRMGFAPLR
jgi:hypothetical protein